MSNVYEYVCCRGWLDCLWGEVKMMSVHWRMKMRGGSEG